MTVEEKTLKRLTDQGLDKHGRVVLFSDNDYQEIKDVLDTISATIYDYGIDDDGDYFWIINLESLKELCPETYTKLNEQARKR